MESGRGAGTVAAAPTIIFVVKSVSVSIAVSISVYGVGLGESDSLPIGLDINFLDISVFYGPSPPSFPLTVLPELGSVVTVVSSPTTMRPPPEDQDRRTDDSLCTKVMNTGEDRSPSPLPLLLLQRYPPSLPSYSLSFAEKSKGSGVRLKEGGGGDNNDEDDDNNAKNNEDNDNKDESSGALRSL